MKYEEVNEDAEMNEVAIEREPVAVKWKPKSMKTEITDDCKKKPKRGHHFLLRRNEPKEKVEQLCRVCAEQAAGYHYGVFTCEGCKSFFGRYQKGKRKPPQECMSGQGQCDIRSRARNRCRYCRYQKCLSAGMSKSASRYGRRSNWFKVHCLSEAQEEESKRGSQPTDSTLSPLVVNTDGQNAFHFAKKRSPPSHISVISPPIVVNPTPIYAHLRSPNFLRASGVIQPNPFHGPLAHCSMDGSTHNTFAVSFQSHSKALPLSAATTSAFTPVIGYFPLPSIATVAAHAAFPNLAYTNQLSVPPDDFVSQAPPIQNEPLDLSLKPPLRRT